MALEHTTASIAGAQPQPYVLRATTIFRREGGEWKVVHRHGDAMGTKPVILKAVLDQAMAGDDAPVPIADRLWFTEALDEPDPARSLQLHARNLCWILQRVAPLMRAVETAAAVDAAAATLWHNLSRQRRTGTANVAANLAAKATLRCEERSVDYCSACSCLDSSGGTLMYRFSNPSD